MNVFELFAVLNLQKDDYEKALNDTENKSKGWARKVESFLKSKAVTAWVAVGVAIVEVGKKLNNLMNQSLQFADQIGETANKLGVSTETIGEMSYVATQTGTTLERISSSMSMLYMRAQRGQEIFEELGVSVKDANGNFKAMDDLFFETIGVLNQFEDENAKSAYMVELMGRGAVELGEILRKDTEELNAMRQEAHELGIVVSQETADFAGSWFDKIDQIKLQGQSALASLVAGAPDAEEKLQAFFDNLMEMLDTYIPTFVSFVVRLITQGAIALIRVLPSLVVDIISTLIDTILSINWLQLGIDIGKAIIEGIINIIVSGLNLILGIFGVKIPKVKLFGDSEKSDYFADVNTGEEYEISENINQTIEVKVEASGDSAVSEDTAEKTAQALAPYIDKILGGK